MALPHQLSDSEDKLSPLRAGIGPCSENGKEVIAEARGRGLNTNELQQPQGNEEFNCGPYEYFGGTFGTGSSWEE